MSSLQATPEWQWVPQASAIAREAGQRLREFFAQGVETEYKGEADLVTVADRTSEKLIRERLAATFPEHGIYGEEGTRERLGSRFRWYVDPLDGTTNFAHGFPQFCVSLGLEDRQPRVRPCSGRTKTGRWWPPYSTTQCATNSSPPSGTGRAAERQADARFAHPGTV